MMRQLLLTAVLLGSAACAASKDDKTFEIRRDAAKQYYDMGDLTRAADRAKAALEIEPNDTLSLAILGMTKTRQARSTTTGVQDLKLLADALATFEKAEANGGTSDFRVMIGHGFARMERAHALLTHAESCEQKIAAHQAATPSKDLEAETAKLKQDAQKAREIAQNDLEIARARLTKAYELQPTYPEVMERMQALASLQNNPTESVSWGQRVLDVLDRSRTERSKMLESLGRDPKSEDTARAEIRRYDHKEAGVRSLMALMLFRMNQTQDACNHLDRVLELDADRVDDYYNRGVCRQALGMYALAARDYETYVKRSTLAPEAKEMREVWDRLSICRAKAGAPPLDVTQKSDK